MANYQSYAEIKAAIKAGIKTPKGSKDTWLDEIINMVYMNEVMVCDDLNPLFWMVDFDDSLGIKAPGTISGISAADPGDFTATAHGFVSGDLISVYSVAGMVEVNNRTYRAGTPADANSLGLELLDASDEIDTTDYTTYTSGGVFNHQGLTLSQEINRILKVRCPGYDPMDPILYDEIEESNTALSETTGRPIRYTHKKQYLLSDGSEIDQLLWFPAADQAYDLRVWFEKRAAPLSNTSDEPLLPPQFRNTIISGVMARLTEYEAVQVENAVIWPAMYKSQIDALKSFNRKHYEDALKHKRVNTKPYLL